MEIPWQNTSYFFAFYLLNLPMEVKTESLELKEFYINQESHQLNIIFNLVQTCS